MVDGKLLALYPSQIPFLNFRLIFSPYSPSESERLRDILDKFLPTFDIITFSDAYSRGSFWKEEVLFSGK